MKLSIIIPLYNNENTLRRCVESVIAQNFYDCEIIIVNDGSTDKSGAIADEWARKDYKITVIHKTNGGPSDAKNYGLNVVKGDYVTFVDSDDELSAGTLLPLMDILENHPEYDILEYSVMQHVGHYDECYLNIGNHVFKNAIDWLAHNGCNHCWMWNKIFRKELFNNLRFPKQLRRFEDMWMMGEMLKRNPLIATTSCGTYKYYWNSNGLMASMDNYTELVNAQMSIIQKHSINTREKRWHKLYMDIYDIQLYVYLQSGKIVIPSQRVVPRLYNGMQGLIKSLALDIFGLKASCRLFKSFFILFKKGKI